MEGFLQKQVADFPQQQSFGTGTQPLYPPSLTPVESGGEKSDSMDSFQFSAFKPCFRHCGACVLRGFFAAASRCSATSRSASCFRPVRAYAVASW